MSGFVEEICTDTSEGAGMAIHGKLRAIKTWILGDIYRFWIILMLIKTIEPTRNRQTSQAEKE